MKELAGFDIEAQPSIDPKQIRDLAASPAEATFNQDHNPMVGAVLHDAKGAVPGGV